MSIGDAPGVQFSFVSKITNSGTLRHHALVHVLGKVGKKTEGRKGEYPSPGRQGVLRFSRTETSFNNE